MFALLYTAQGRGEFLPARSLLCVEWFHRKIGITWYWCSKHWAQKTNLFQRRAATGVYGCAVATFLRILLHMFGHHWSGPTIKSCSCFHRIRTTHICRSNFRLQHRSTLPSTTRASKEFRVLFNAVASVTRCVPCRAPRYRLAVKTTGKVLGTSLYNVHGGAHGGNGGKNQQKHEKFICFARFGDVPFVLYTQKRNVPSVSLDDIRCARGDDNQLHTHTQSSAGRANTFESFPFFLVQIECWLWSRGRDENYFAAKRHICTLNCGQQNKFNWLVRSLPFGSANSICKQNALRKRTQSQ